MFNTNKGNKKTMFKRFVIFLALVLAGCVIFFAGSTFGAPDVPPALAKCLPFLNS